MRTLIACLLLLLAGLIRPAGADEILFKNGDRLTGAITQGAGGKVTIKTEAAGEVTVDLAKVKTFSTDKPVQLKVGEKALAGLRQGAGSRGNPGSADERG